MRNTHRKIVTFVSAGLAAFAASALEFSSIFQDDMVLQRDRTQKIWGKATPGETVTVELKNAGGTTVASATSAPAAADGIWLADLTTPGASFAAHTLTATEGTESVTIANVLLGDVWLAGGQSNMAFPLDKIYTAGFSTSELGTDVRFRLLGVPNNGEKTPVVPYELQGGAKWMTAVDAATDTAKGATGDSGWRHFSAVGYFFAKAVRDAANIPVGIVAGSRCGTPVTTFLPGDNMWNYTYGPITNLAVTGMIFYQGCSDAGPSSYVRTFQNVVNSFRSQWRRTAAEFPFYYVQIASDGPALGGTNGDWSQTIFDYDPNHASGFVPGRENQRKALAGLENVGLVVSFDCGATYGGIDKSRGTVADDTVTGNIHPRAKKPIGTRLARFARAGVYGEHIQASGPLFAGAACIGDGRIRVSFASDTTGTKFVAGLRDMDTNADAYEVSKPIFGFAVAGEDGVYRWAGATPDGDTVVVASPEVPNPKFVRYGCFTQPARKPYLYAKASDGVLLPAVPFAEQTATGWSAATARSGTTSLADCTIAFPLTKYYAVDRSCRARPLVYAPNGALLRENESYTVSYANVGAPGTATVTVTAKSALFTGAKSADYTLRALDLTKCIENTFAGSAASWTGGPVMMPHKYFVPPETVNRFTEEDVWQMGGWDAMYLRPNTDYKLTGDCTSPGSTTLTVEPLTTGLTGTRTISSSISVPIERCTVSAVAPQEYTGEAIQPTVTVTAPEGCPKLTYRVAYKNNTEPTDLTNEATTAYVTVTGAGSYTGCIQLPYAIYRRGEAMPTRTVRFLSFGETVATVNVPFGTAATAPANPAAPGWAFVGWDADFSRVTADLTVRARWTRAIDRTSFAKKATIRFAGYAGAETVTNFVALVKVSPATIGGFAYADCAADGSDLRFVDAWGNLVGHEIDTWNPGGVSLVWVRVPQLTGTETCVCMYWGGSGAASPRVAPTDTWRAYAGVWHMNETGDGMQATMADATGLSACSCDSDISFATDGVIGGGRANPNTRMSGELAAGYGALVRVESAAAIAARAGHRFAVSFWARPSDLSDTPYVYFSNGVWEKSLGTYTVGKISAGIGRYGEFRLWGGTGAASNPNIVGNDRFDVWRKYDIAFDGANVVIYSDGKLLTTARTDGWAARVDPFAAFGIGGLTLKAHNNAPSFYRGTMDETRFLAEPATAGRMAADYATVAENATFTAYSAAVNATDEDPEPPTPPEPPAEHVHVWSAWTTNTAPTCLAAGEKTRTCTRAGCGATETEAIPPLEPEPDPGAHIATENGYIIPLDMGSYTNLVRVFTNTEAVITWTVPTGVTAIDYLVVGAGGGGGAQYGGGGAGGQVVRGTALAVAPEAEATLTVGPGGAGGTYVGRVAVSGANGGATTFAIGGHTFEALGGGGGGGFQQNGLAGANGGGGGGRNGKGVAGTVGFAGGDGSSTLGGAGAGAGGNGGTANGTALAGGGGAGVTDDITGVAVAYAGGGGGGGNFNTKYAWGYGGVGTAGGGNGATHTAEASFAATSGQDGLGAGGGGGAHEGKTLADYEGAKGGNGAVFVRYRLVGDLPRPEHVHQWSEWGVVTPAQRGVDGEERRTCANCDLVESRVIPALPLDFSHTNFVGRIICVGDSIYATGPSAAYNADGTLKEGRSTDWIHAYFPGVEVLSCAANGWRAEQAYRSITNLSDKVLAETDAVLFRIGLNGNWFGDPFDTGDHKPTFTYADIQDHVTYEDALPHLGTYTSAYIIRMANHVRKRNPKAKFILIPYMMYTSYDRYESRKYWEHYQMMADGLDWPHYNNHIYGGDTSKNAYDRRYSIDQCHHAALRHEFEGDCVARLLENELADGAKIVRSSPRGRLLVAGDNAATAATIASAFPGLSVSTLAAGSSADLFDSVRTLSDADIRKIDVAVLRAGSGEGAFGDAFEVLPQHDPSKKETCARNVTGLDWDYRWEATMSSSGYVWPRSCGPDAVAECASNTLVRINQTVATLKSGLAGLSGETKTRLTAVVDYMENATDAQKLAELTTGFRWIKGGVTNDIATLDQYWTALGTSPCANVAKAAQYLRLKNPRIKIIFERYADDADANAGLDSIGNPYQLNWPCVATADVTNEVYIQAMTRTSAAYWQESEDPDTRTPVTLPPQGTKTFAYDGQDHKPAFAETADYTVAYSAETFVTPGSYDVTFTLKEPATHKWADYVGDIVIYKYDITESPGHAHVWSAWTTNAAPDCVTSGQRTRLCTAAGCTDPAATETETLAALGHLWGEWQVTKPAEVGVAGEKTRTCTRAGCGATETEAIPPLPRPDAKKPMEDPSLGYWMDVEATGGVTNRVLVFTNATKTASWQVPADVTTLDYLMVGGGGGGGFQYGGGGGGGGVLSGTMSVTAGDTLTVAVGAGGAGGAAANAPGANGGASALTNGVAEVACALGGGGGACLNTVGLKGANGGGGSYAKAGGVATMTGGFAGGQGAGGKVGGSGGGGAGGAGAGTAIVNSSGGKAGDGGAGVTNDITGTAVAYAGGGGGGGNGNVKYAWGYGGVGQAGGGNGGSHTAEAFVAATPGEDGLGAGGGGGAHEGASYAGAKGGNGTVILRYALPKGEVPAKPTVDGKEVEPDKVFETARTDKPITYPAAPTVAGEVGAQMISYGGTTTAVPVYYTATLSGNMVSLALNDNAKPSFGDKDATKAIEVTGDGTVRLNLTNVHAALYYTLQTCASLGGGWSSVVTQQGRADFEAQQQGCVRFFRIEVSDAVAQ